MAVEIHTVYEGHLRCTATHGPSQVQLSTDAPLDNGGQAASFSPTDLVATALGTCVMTIMALVAERHQLDLRGTQVHVTKEMIQTPIRRIRALRTSVRFPVGLQVDDADRARLKTAANLCPVHQSIHPDIDAPIEFIYS